MNADNGKLPVSTIFYLCIVSKLSRHSQFDPMAIEWHSFTIVREINVPILIKLLVMG